MEYIITRAFEYVYFRNILYLEGERTEVLWEMENVLKLLQIFVAYLVLMISWEVLIFLGFVFQQLGWMGRLGSLVEVHWGKCAEAAGPCPEAEHRQEYKASASVTDYTKKPQRLDLLSCSLLTILTRISIFFVLPFRSPHWLWPLAWSSGGNGKKIFYILDYVGIGNL